MKTLAEIIRTGLPRVKGWSETRGLVLMWKAGFLYPEWYKLTIHGDGYALLEQVDRHDRTIRSSWLFIQQREWHSADTMLDTAPTRAILGRSTPKR